MKNTLRSLSAFLILLLSSFGLQGQQALCSGQHVANMQAGASLAFVSVSDLDQGSFGGTVFIRRVATQSFDTLLTFTCSELYQNVAVELFVRDTAGVIVSMCTSWVYITDDLNVCQSSSWPQAQCQTTVFASMTPTGLRTVFPHELDAGSTGLSSLQQRLRLPFGSEQNVLNFDCSELGTYQVYLLVEDSLGRRDSCSSTLLIQDPQGFCAPAPCVDSSLLSALSCPSVYAPVCGCDSLTYDNACIAERVHGISSWTAGPCSQQLGCIDSTRIDPSRFCPTVYQPVCGCDDNTYNNACEAEFVYGIRFWTYGACPDTTFNNAARARVYTMNSSCAACDGQAFVLTAGAPAAYTYIWSDDSLNNSARRERLCAGSYTVFVMDSLGLTDTVVFQIGTELGCVWPGDTDNNSLVNNFDVLNIALTHGESGFVRPNASSQWIAQIAPDWNTVNPLRNLPNYKHIDANGDGIINQNDLAVISQNYSQSYWRSDFSKDGNIPLFVEAAVAQEGERLRLPIHLGSAINPATSVYGLAFTINYDPSLVFSSSLSVDVAQSWLGNDLLFFEKLEHGQGKIEVSIARKDRQDISNFGQVASLNLTIRDDILRRNNSEELPIRISNVRLIDKENNEQGTTRPESIVEIGIANALEEQRLSGLQIFPNPLQDMLFLQLEEGAIQNLRLRTVLGQELLFIQNIESSAYQLPCKDLAQGQYLLEVELANGQRLQKLLLKP